MRELGIYDNISWKKHELMYTLAGGYTHQHFYDSIEGAVQSGKIAAEKLIKSTAWV